MKPLKATREEMLEILTQRARKGSVSAAAIVLRELNASDTVPDETDADQRYQRLRLLAYPDVS